MKVVVFGGCGFLGSWLVKKLLDNNFKPIIFDKEINKNLLKKIIDLSGKEIDFIKGDITDYNQVFAASQRGEILINLAGLMTPDCSQNPVAGNAVNVVGSINVFEAGKNQNNKFVIYTSSGGVFGRNDQELPFPETHYGAFKLAVEGIARAMFLENKFSSFGLRPFVIYGPGREIGGTAGLSLACKASARNEDYTIPFSGKAGFVFVDDVTEIIFRLIKQRPKGANVLNINGISSEISDIIKILSKINKNNKISSKKNNLPVVGEILGNSPENYFNDFVFTCLDKGIMETVGFYKNYKRD